MSAPNRNTKKLISYRFSIETLVLIEKLAKMDKRDNTNYLENDIANKAKYLGISVSQEEVDQFILRMEEKNKKNQKK